MKRSLLSTGSSLALLALGCATPAPAQDALGPYSLHCGSEGAQPTCVRFHAVTGAVRRLELSRIPKGEADPAESARGNVYTLTCRHFAVGEGAHAPDGTRPLLCLRLDTQSGEVVFVEAEALPTGL